MTMDHLVQLLTLLAEQQGEIARLRAALTESQQAVAAALNQQAGPSA